MQNKKNELRFVKKGYLESVFVNNIYLINMHEQDLTLKNQNGLKRQKNLVTLFYITYDMDFRFVPNDPVCFEKLSGCD